MPMAARRIRILPMAERIPLGAHFQTVAGAILQRSRLHIHYYNRSRYELRVPYSDPRELVMDILKYGADVEVVAPAELRREAVQRLLTAVSAYQAKETDP